MSNDLFKAKTDKWSDQIKDVVLEQFNKTIENYEHALMIDDNRTIRDNISMIKETFAQDTRLFLATFENLVVICDTMFVGLSSFFYFSKVKILDLERYGYAKLKKDDFLELMSMFQDSYNASQIGEETIIALSKYVEKYVDGDSLEYRVLRIICITSTISLNNTPNVISKFILQQEKLNKLSKISTSIFETDI